MPAKMPEPRVLEEHRSPDGLLDLLVVREGEDISIGFRGSQWHTHADIEAEYSGLPEAEAVRDFVDRILADRTALAAYYTGDNLTEVTAHFSPDEVEAVAILDRRYMAPEERIIYRLWSGRVLKSLP